MKTMHKILKLSLSLFIVVMMIFSLSVLSDAASDKFIPIIETVEDELYGTETFEQEFSLKYKSQLKIYFEGYSDYCGTYGEYTFEVIDSLDNVVYTVTDESTYDDKEYLVDELPAGDYTFVLRCVGDSYYYDELEYSLSISYRIIEDVPVESITIDKSAIYLCVKDKITLNGKISPEEAESKIVWSSSDKSIATVSSNGTVKGIAAGKAVITAKADGKTKKCNVTVFSPTGKTYKQIGSIQQGTVDSGKTKKNKFTLKTYSKVKINFTGLDSNSYEGTYGYYDIKIKNSDGEVVYTVRDESRYDDKSHTTPVLPKGTYTFILSSCGESYYSYDLDYMYKISYMTVADIAIKKVNLNATSVSLAKGKSTTLKATPDPSYVTDKITWSSSNEKVATVSSKGKVTAKTLGTAKITAKIGSKKASCTVKVDSMSATVIKKRTTKLASYITNISGYKNAKWSSSNTSIATVDKTGKVTGKANGSCYIYCTINKVKYTFNLKVKPAITATPAYVSDDSIYNDAGIKFTNNTNLDITYVTLNINQYDNRGYKLSSPYSYYYINDTIKANTTEGYEFWVNESTKKITCSIKKVWFSDGTTWTP